MSLAQLFPYLADQPSQQASPEPPTEPVADLSEPPIFTKGKRSALNVKGFRARMVNTTTLLT